jgi:predicted site-specific integrase-resolvase
MNPNTDPLNLSYDKKTRLLVRLAIVYEKLKSLDQGDNLWRQIVYFHTSQGNQCALVGEISQKFDMSSINTELANLNLELNQSE